MNHSSELADSSIRPLAGKLPEFVDTLQLGSATLDISTREIFRDNHRVRLTPKSMQVLLVLIDHAPRTVSRSELLDKVWPGAEINDAIVTDAIRTLRRAFNQAGEHQELIKTVPRAGYRLTQRPQRVTRRRLGPVNVIAMQVSKRPKWMVAALLGVLTLTSLLLWWQISTNSGLQSVATIQNPYYKRARAFYERYRMVDNEKAVEIFLAGLTETPNDPLLLSGLAEAYVQRFDAYRQSREWAEKGYELAMRAVHQAPELSPVQRAAGLASVTMGYRQKAEAHYREAIRIDPTNRQAIGNLAYMYLSSRHLLKALPLFKKGLEIEPSSARAHMFMGICYAEVGAFEIAERWFEKANRLGLTHAEDREEYIQMLAWQGLHQRARTLIEQTSAEADRQTQLSMMGMAMAQAGLPEQAHTAFEELFQIPDTVDGLLNDAAARWISLDVPPTDIEKLRTRVTDSIQGLVEHGPHGIPLPAIQHEVAVRLFALERIEEGEHWLRHAVEGGWINYHQTRAEPAIRRALTGYPELLNPIMTDLEARQTQTRHLVIARDVNQL